MIYSVKQIALHPDVRGFWERSEMFSKDLTMPFLLDFYGDLLSPRQRNVLSLYYEDDLSLSEIGDELNISRQGVRHIIKKGEDQLKDYESRLGLEKRFSETRTIVDEVIGRLKKIRENAGDDSVAEEIDKIMELTKSLSE